MERLGADARPAGDLRPRVAGLAEPADLIGLAEVCHLAEGADAGEGQLGVVFEAERPVGSRAVSALTWSSWGVINLG